MSRTRLILSNFSVVNILLASVLIVFTVTLVLPFFGKRVKFKLPSPKKQAAVVAKPAEKPAESKSPSPSDYFLIAEQNIFHPERRIPPEKKEVVAPPLPKPEFVLYGTLVLDDLRIAYMEDKKAPQTSPTRGKRQISLRQGEALSGFVLKEIKADMVVMVRGDEKLDVHLDDPRSKTREYVGASTAQAAVPVQPGAQQQQRPQQPTSAPAAAIFQGTGPQPTPQSVPGQRSLFRRNANRTSNYNVD